MNNHISVINQNPVAIIKALNAPRVYAGGGQFLHDMICYGFYLSRAFSRADQKVIGNYRETLQFQYDKVSSLLLKGMACGCNCQIFTF